MELRIGCCRISIYRKLSILKRYRIFTFAVSQISKYQNSDIIDGGKNVEVFEPKQSSKTTQICLKGALDNILKFYFWLNFIYHVKCNC